MPTIPMNLDSPNSLLFASLRHRLAEMRILFKAVDNYCNKVHLGQASFSGEHLLNHARSLHLAAGQSVIDCEALLNKHNKINE